MPLPFPRRRQQLRKLLRAEKLDGMIVTTERNILWLTGFTGEDSYLFVTLDTEILITDFRFVTQAEEECREVEAFIRPSTMKIDEAVANLSKKHKLERLGFEEHSATVEMFHRWQEGLTGKHLVQLARPIEGLRAVKDAEEIAQIREAVRLAERGFEVFKALLTPAITEAELAAELEHALRRFGAEGFSFPAIVAVGDRAALPHYRAGGISLSASPILLIDWGARARSGYVSDLTRTLLTDKPDRKFEKVYKTVLEAQTRAIERIAPGVVCKDVDAVAREVIRAAGFDKYFGHGLGHGIGLDVHESPSLRRNSDTVLRAGMVVTVEPGIYLPGWGGVRIEDDVLVTRQGHEALSSLPKDWNSIRVSF